MTVTRGHSLQTFFIINPARLVRAFLRYTMHHSLVFLFSSMTTAWQSIGLHLLRPIDGRLAQGHVLAVGA